MELEEQTTQEKALAIAESYPELTAKYPLVSD